MKLKSVILGGRERSATADRTAPFVTLQKEIGGRANLAVAALKSRLSGA
jgi:hypothetical protein